jgi:hypothetical protein
LPFIAGLFPQVPALEKAANALLKVIESKKSPKIGINIEQLLPETNDEQFPMPNFRDAVAAIERKDPKFSLTIPEHSYHNPFTGEDKVRPARTFSTTAEMLLFVCSIASVDLKGDDEATTYDSIVGHIHQGDAMLPSRVPKRHEQAGSQENEIAQIVRKLGWLAASITDQKPEYVFSIGLMQTMNHPEFVIFGLPPDVAHGVLAELVREIAQGKSFAKPENYTIRLKGKEYPLGLRPVHASKHCLYLGHAINYYNYLDRHRELEVMQVFWNDDQGHFPFDAGCEPEVCKRQPRLDLATSPRKTASIKNLREMPTSG